MAKRMPGDSHPAGRLNDVKLMPLKLPKPDLEGRGSLKEALENRKTSREISSRELPDQILSNLLWSACGINRLEGPFGIPGRTSASAGNSQEIDLYVVLQKGIYLYNPVKLILTPVVTGDYYTYAIGKGQAGFGDKAPVRIIFVADLDKLIHTQGYREPGLLDPEVQKSYYFTDTGIIAGNVYLFAA